MVRQVDDARELGDLLLRLDAALQAVERASGRLLSETFPLDRLVRGAITRSLDRVAQLRAVLGPQSGGDAQSFKATVACALDGTLAYRPSVKVVCDLGQGTGRGLPECVRLAVVTVVSGAVSNADRHGPGGEIRVRAAMHRTSADIEIMQGEIATGETADGRANVLDRQAGVPLMAGHGMRLMWDVTALAGGALTVVHGPHGSVVFARFASIAPASAPDLDARAAFARHCLAVHGAAAPLREILPLVPNPDGDAIRAALRALDQAEFELLRTTRPLNMTSRGEAPSRTS